MNPGRAWGRVGAAVEGSVLLWGLVLGACTSWGPEPIEVRDRDLGAPRALEVPSGRPVALVIGNGAYEQVSPLGQAPEDARTVAKALEGLGYGVTLLIDVDRRALLDGLVDFGDRVAGASVALVYYSGHGLQVDGKNYLVAVDGALDPRRRKMVHHDHVAAQTVLDTLEGGGSRLNVVVLDACRNDPLGKSLGGGKGLQGMGASGMVVAFATAPGTVAPDNGVYARALVRQLTQPPTECVDWDQAFRLVQDEVSAASAGAQRPWVSDNAGMLTRRMYPSGCERKAEPVPPTPEPQATGPDWITDPVLGRLRRIPAGTFMMGSPASESGRHDDEGPQRQVTLSSFYLMESEVTQAMWRQVMGTNPSGFSGCDDCPVETVSWDDAVAFAQKLSRGGVTYRLPTEAEWEYAALGGEGFVYAGSNDPGEVAWYYRNAEGKTHPVCRKKRNAYELCDMSGNVWEWVSDWYAGEYPRGAETDPTGPQSGSLRVKRGGCWVDSARYVRVANRFRSAPGSRDRGLGFRLARSSP